MLSFKISNIQIMVTLESVLYIKDREAKQTNEIAL